MPIRRSLVFVAPLLLSYQAGLAVTGPEALNGVDFLTIILRASGGTGAALAFNALVLVALSGALFQLRRRGAFGPTAFFGLACESLVYAACLGSVIRIVMDHLPLTADPGHGLPMLTRVVIALGAGVNEEVVFRLLGFSGFLALGKRLLGRESATLVLAGLIGSSLLFAAAHHLGPGAEAWALDRFVFRALAGLFLGLLHRYRGFAVAVYTHVLYDVLVLCR